jgi:hypothetical protein
MNHQIAKLNNFTLQKTVRQNAILVLKLLTIAKSVELQKMGKQI